MFWIRIDFKAIDGVKKLHDLISTDYNRMARHGENIMLFLERKFPFLEELKKQTFQGLNIIIPQDKATLIEWGEKLGNCIGGYGERYNVCVCVRTINNYQPI